MAEFAAPDGLRLYYTDNGDGLPLLCLPGLTRTGRDFDYLRPHLPALRTVTLDYRGRGQSAWADDPSSYNLRTEAGDVLALLDHLGIGAAAILGTSRGGLIAMGLAAAAPDRLLGAALNDVGPVIEATAIDSILAVLGRPPIWTSHAEAAEALSLIMPGFSDVPAARWLNEARLHFPVGDDGHLTISYDPRLREAIAAQAAEPTPDLWPFFDALAGKPTCAIRGGGSPLLSAETFAEMHRRRPDMIAAEVPGRGHVPFLDETEALAALRAWLEQMQ